MPEGITISNAFPSLEFPKQELDRTRPIGLSPFFCYMSLYFISAPQPVEFSTEALDALKTRREPGENSA